MKLSSRLAKLKHHKVATASARPGQQAAPWITPAAWLLVGLCLVLAGLGTLAVFEFFVWNKVPPELVGFWEVAEGPQKGGTLSSFAMASWRSG